MVENNFLKTFAPNHFIENLDSETLAEKSEATICISSNLGPELMSKGHKVLFLNVHSFLLDWQFKDNKLEICYD